MKKQSQIKDQIIITITLIAVFGILVLSVIWLANNDPKYDPRLEAEGEYHESVRRNHLMDDYMEILHIKGEYTIEDDEVIFESQEQEMWKLIEDVSLYNAFYPEEPLTAEELNYEFELFCQDWIGSDNMRKLERGLIEIEYRAEKAGINLEDYGYHLKVAKRLDDYGTNIYDATTEQWYKASEYAANALYIEVANKE
ncbi:MAG: hypothetical protein IKJ73_10270 [Lachnospiraceae bacterium]|nr:hypothetical protein [Lachnospiraceae bacterium]